MIRVSLGFYVRRNLTHLRELNVDEGRFNDNGLRGLTGLTALRSLSLRSCHDISDAGLRAVVVPLSRHSLAWVDVTGCERLTDLSRVGFSSFKCTMCWLLNLHYGVALQPQQSPFLQEADGRRVSIPESSVFAAGRGNGRHLLRSTL